MRCEYSFSDLLVEPVRNGVYKKKHFHGRGAPVINMKELFAFERIDGQHSDRVELSHDEMARFSLQEGDLLFARRSFVLEGAGKCAVVGVSPEPIVFESSIIRARVDRSIADPDYLYYFFRSPQGRGLMASIANRTAVSGITGTNLSRLKFDLPSVEEQHAVVAVLGAYGDLIENNSRRIQILEQMAQAIYREQLVGFRYPGHEEVPLVDSDVGLIPEGWEALELQDLVEEVKRGVDPSSVPGETPYIGLEHMPEHSIAIAEWGKASDAGSRKFRYEAGDVLFGKIRPYFHKVGIPPVEGICSTDAIVIRPRSPEFAGLALAVASSNDFVAYAVQTSNGTKMPRANWDVLEHWPVAVPPPPLREQFADYMACTVDLIHRLVMTNRNLRAARDLVLPHLISGEIDVSALNLPGVA
jgi:type I restriction enzyme S subunit